MSGQCQDFANQTHVKFKLLLSNHYAITTLSANYLSESLQSAVNWDCNLNTNQCWWLKAGCLIPYFYCDPFFLV